MALIQIAKNEASNVASVEFTGIDNTYKVYVLKYALVNPVTDSANLQFQVTTDGTNYNKTMTTTTWRDRETDGGTTTYGYSTGEDQAQATGFQPINAGIGSDADESASGELFLFNPSSSTFVKHFQSTGCGAHSSDAAQLYHVCGYINTTDAVTGIKIQFDGGNMDGFFTWWGLL